MFNMQSPIINNMGLNNQIYGYQQPQQFINYQQPQQFMNYQQPQMNYGYPQQFQTYGYPPQQQYYNMGSYYNGNQMYYNPYLQQNLYYQQQIQQQEIMKKQSEIMKTLSRNLHKSMGNEISEEELSELYDPKPIDPKMYEMMNTAQHIAKLETLSKNPITNTPVQKIIDNNNKRLSYIKQSYPDDMSLFDFLEKAGELYTQIVNEEYMAKSKEINNLYNQSQYKDLLNSSMRPDSYSSTILNFKPNDNFSLDDLEITLPNQIASKYEQRRSEFLQSILS